MDFKAVKKETIFLYGILIIYALFFFPFWVPITLSAIFACGLSPALTKIRNRVMPKRHRSMTFIGIIFVALLLLVFGLGLAGSISELAGLLKQERIEKYLGDVISLKDKIPEWVRTHTEFTIPEDSIKKGIEQAAAAISTFALTVSQKFFFATPEAFLKTLIFFLSFIYFLHRVEKAPQRTKKIFPASAGIVEQFISASSHVLFSTFLIGGAQSLIIATGALICGFKSFLLVFFVTFIFSLIPVIGAGSFGIFLALLALIEGNQGEAIGMLVVALIAGTSDNIIRSLANASHARSNVIVSFIALIGAIALIGVPAIFIAPVVESLTLHMIRSRKSKSSVKVKYALTDKDLEPGISAP